MGERKEFMELGSVQFALPAVEMIVVKLAESHTENIRRLHPPSFAMLTKIGVTRDGVPSAPTDHARLTIGAVSEFLASNILHSRLSFPAITA